MEDRLHRVLARLGQPRLARDLAELDARSLVRFDERLRSYNLRVPWASAPLLRLCSPNGYERAEAVRAVTLTPLTTRLVVLRAVDWVPQVREAALSRLDACPNDLLVEALPLAEQLATERERGPLLEALLDARLRDDDLRLAARADDPRTRRAAWLRLGRRGALRPDELELAARDEDVAVRAMVVRALEDAPATQRRALAERLLEDRIGWIAARALSVLVALDGAAAIAPALTARSATLRRAARDWARVRDVDARAVYLAREPRDQVALVGLAELGDPRDMELIRGMVDHPRGRVRLAGLRALARLDRPAARRVALAWLEAGGGRVVAAVLRDGAPSPEEVDRLPASACDRARSWGQRERALSLLRPGTWTHFTVAMEASLLTGTQPVPSGTPAPHLRRRIERLLPAYDGPRRTAIEFALR